MNYNFALIELVKKEDILKKRWMKRMPRKLYLHYVLKYLPVETTEAAGSGESGLEVILPFTKEELGQLKETYIESLLEHIKFRYGIEYIFLSDGFSQSIRQKYCEDKIKESMLKYIMFPQIFERVLKESKIDFRDLSLIIIDSGNRKIEFILEMIYHNLNHLKIITGRQEYFEDFKEMIYDNTGLVVEVVKKGMGEYSEGNIVIDMNEEISREYRNFNKEAVMIHMESTREKQQYYHSRSKSMKIMYHIEVEMEKKPIENHLLEMMLYSKYQEIRDFTQEKKWNNMVQKTQKIVNVNQLKIRSLKYL